jgi:hypothetical protein
MKAASLEPSNKKAQRTRSKYIGRSAATGLFIFKPVSVKGSLISQHQANTAVRLVSNTKK